MYHRVSLFRCFVWVWRSLCAVFSFACGVAVAPVTSHCRRFGAEAGGPCSHGSGPTSPWAQGLGDLRVPESLEVLGGNGPRGRWSRGRGAHEPIA